jgi:predicted secreted hydrolase
LVTWRRLGLLCAAVLAVIVSARAEVRDERAVRGPAIQFPQDEGSHPEFRTEWWYLTGWVRDARGNPFGFQITFFRHRPGSGENNPSRFALRQLLFAHVSLSDPAHGKLRRAEKIARAGFGLAEAHEGKLDVHIDDWSLRQDGSAYRASVGSREFRFDLVFESQQAPLLHGDGGISQKTPDPQNVSHYYSLPQLVTRGRIWTDGVARDVEGTAWLDHEWFDAVLDERAQGWDWAGLNLDDGTALMASRMRLSNGETYWAAATWRKSGGTAQTFGRGDVEWSEVRRWRSPRTAIEYPVEFDVRVGDRTIRLRPLLDDQENDARRTAGTIYWEGAVRAFDEQGRPIGRGYLELTGYGERIRF